MAHIVLSPKLRTLLKFLVILHFLDTIKGDDVIGQCKLQCVTEISDQADGDSWRCNHACRMQKCLDGCELWQDALESTCRQSCSIPGYTYNEQQYCSTGCNKALDIYFSIIDRQYLSDLGRPVLAAGSRYPTSVILKWNRPAQNLTHIEYKVQKKYGNLTSDWHDHNEVQWTRRGRVRVYGLHPYVIYQFRILVMVTSRHSVISNESVPIATAPQGVPTDPPTILSISTSATSIHVKWAPPFLKNMQLVVYRITVTKLPSGKPSVKEVEVVNDNDPMSEVMTLLEPATQYKVSVVAVNREGAGPAAEATVTTQTESIEGVSPYLLLGANNRVLLQDLADVFALPSVIYEAPNQSNLVLGVGADYNHSRVYFSDSTGRVWGKSTITSESQTAALIYQSAKRPTAISCDWLHQKLYIAEDTQITECNLKEDKDCRVIIRDLTSKPEDVKVDPCNGYLYWTQHGHGRGLFRVDLADLSRPDLHLAGSLAQYLLVPMELLTTLCIDFLNYRLYLPHEGQNTVLSYYVDGTDVRDMRASKVQTPSYVSVKSIAYFNELFCWVSQGDEKEVVTLEERDASGHIYHNDMFFEETHFAGLNIWHPTAQPIPVPLLAPRDLQALFSMTKAVVSWKEPDTDQGKGAWREWRYEVELHTRSPQYTNKSYGSLASVSITINNLQPETRYQFRVRAYSQGGFGPWSDVFAGYTLREDAVTPYLAVVGEAAIYRLGLDGENMEAILNHTVLTGVRDLEIYKDQLLWSMDSGVIYRKLAWQAPKILLDIQNAGAIAYDWLANTLYWASIKHTNMILRSVLSQDLYMHPETVIQETAGFAIQDITLDPVEGYIYWTTLHSIGAARLDGTDYNPIVNVLPNFSGKYILGLALDAESGLIYWLEKEGERMVLYQMPGLLRHGYQQQPAGDPLRAGAGRQHSKILDFKSNAMYPIMQLYSNKLFWQSGPEEMVVLDIGGQSPARMVVDTPGKRFTRFAVYHPALFTYPAGLDEETVKVVPSPVDSSSVQVKGDWDRFNVSWQVSSVNHGEVYYEVLMLYSQQGRQQDMKVESKTPYLIVTNMAPYTAVAFTIKACTHWGCSSPAHSNFTTPMSAPGPPRRPRVFITHHRYYQKTVMAVEVDFRWDAPRNINGVIKVYEVQQSSERTEGTWERFIYDSDTLHHSFSNALQHTMYYFKVRACTNECGDETNVVKANTTIENPVPRLFTTTQDSIRLFYPDERKSQKFTSATGAQSLAFIAHESTIYWLDKRGYIMKQSSMRETKEVIAVNGIGRDLAADWIGRDLYWLVQKPTGYSDIMKYDLNKDSGKPLLVLTRVSVLWKMAVNPYKSTLFWTETSTDGKGQVMTCNKKGQGIRSLLKGNRGRRRRKKKGKRRGRKRSQRVKRQEEDEDEEWEDCTCPELSVLPVFVMDHTDPYDQEIFVVDADTHNLWASDVDGCMCRLLINASHEYDYALPPDSMTVDHERLYWSNASQRVVNSVHKVTGRGFMTEDSGDLENIIVYGEHLQPMPDVKCLTTGEYKLPPELLTAGNTSLTLQLTLIEPEQEAGCEDVSTTSIKYTVHYRELPSKNDPKMCDHPEVRCKTVSTFDPVITVPGLAPHTNYRLQISASNFYMEVMPGAGMVLGPPAVFQTKSGIPSPPRDVSAEPTTPTTANVTWKTPAELNGLSSDIVYVVDWHTYNKDGTRSHGTVDAEPKPLKLDHDGGRYYYDLVDNLIAAQRYYFQVQAYDMDRTGYSGSRTVTTVMYQYPGPITLVTASRTSIAVTWTAPTDDSISRHMFEYAQVEADPSNVIWNHLVSGAIIQATNNASRYTQNFTNLIPNQEYAFRMKVIYKNHFQHYIWPQENGNTFKYTFKTAADVPLRPDPPYVRHTSSGINMVLWSAPDDGGAPVIQYRLTARLSTENDPGNWSVVYNGSELRWVVMELEEDEDYVFRVEARNRMGWSEPSDNSSALTYVPVPVAITSSDEQLKVILASVFTVFILVIVVAVIFSIVCFRRYKVHKLMPGLHFVTGFRAVVADTELATLRELPRVARQQANALYAINIVPTKEDIAALPHFRRDQLTLTKFLGSGAFGEVFEGVARNILGEDTGETKVAVKTLRKGASDQEKEEFLKEALLMSNFKHEHILRLLGVCLDNDPQFIILELMEGGDLLSYLRNARATQNSGAKLLLPGMVGICVDVSKGCRYLEDMHFVHRDLAARNCLVSNGYRERVVKIGDFGLARDIYKNDYYRKEGEGLLPVRWMSPESLIDGVFTTQSDVWAFGVLMWEVLTLGQQPYPARTNIEVLHFVRNGGRLDRPETCPDAMYSLMLKCWMYNPDDRPSFHHVLEQLESFKAQCSDPHSEFSGMVPIALAPGSTTYAYVIPAQTDQSEPPANQPNKANETTTNEQSTNDDVDDASNIRRPPTRRERLKAFLTGGGSDSDGSSVGEKHTPPLRKPLMGHHRRSPPFPHCSRQDDSGYLQPLVQPQDKHKYLELLEEGGLGVGAKPKTPSPTNRKTHNGMSPIGGGSGPGKSITYAQLAGGSDEEEATARGRGQRFLSPPPDIGNGVGIGNGGNGKFVPKPADVRCKVTGAKNDTAGMGLNHWPQNNIPALPLPPPREHPTGMLRDPLLDNDRSRSRFERNGKRRSSSLNSRPSKRDRDHSADDETSNYPTRSELRKNPFVEDGILKPRGRGHSAPRVGARDRSGGPPQDANGQQVKYGTAAAGSSGGVSGNGQNRTSDVSRSRGIDGGSGFTPSRQAGSGSSNAGRGRGEGVSYAAVGGTGSQSQQNGGLRGGVKRPEVSRNSNATTMGHNKRGFPLTESNC